MAQVTVKINGFSYNVGCENGQEPHLMTMASEVDSRIDSIKKLGGNMSESRLLVLASLLLADELHDLKTELEAARAAPASAAARAPRPAKPAGEVNRRMSKLAERAEQIAADLDRS